MYVKNDIKNYSTFICLFESGKSGKKKKEKNTKIWISREWRAFWMKSKAFFIVFEGLSFGPKKIVQTSFRH